MPRIYQSMIQACAREAGAWMTTKYDVLNPQAVKRLVASGAELRPFPQPVMEACYNAAISGVAARCARPAVRADAADRPLTGARRERRIVPFPSRSTP